MIDNIQKLTELVSNKNKDTILVEYANRLIKLSLKDIIAIEADGDFCKIHTKAKIYLTGKNITELEKRLKVNSFQRIHRSWIIALEEISEVYKNTDGPCILLSNGMKLKVSRSYIPDFRKLIL
ncbi:MAG: DNA-binding response regulator [Chitinophagaceae bacterium]|nr:DNA-binding response regulator [Chitinophagaceae bacterium]